MGQTGQILSLLEGLSRWRPEFMGAMPWYLTAYFAEKAGLSPDAALAAAESAPLGESYTVRPLEAQRCGSHTPAARCGQVPAGLPALRQAAL